MTPAYRLTELSQFVGGELPPIATPMTLGMGNTMWKSGTALSLIWHYQPPEQIADGFFMPK